MKNTSTKRLVISLLLSITLCVLAIGGCWLVFSKSYSYILDMMEEDSKRQSISLIKEMNLHITEETSLKEITDSLYDNAFIGYKTLFEKQGQLYKIEEKMQPGTYVISNNMRNEDIFDLISISPDHEEDTVKFTIPEGFTVLQIANRLDDLGIVGKNDFLRAVQEKEYTFSFLEEIPTDVKFKLEGYLFPDTYIVRKDATAEEIVMKMLSRFENVYKEYAQYLYTSPYTLFELTTIASIIEQEARLDEERPVISGVIYNRLADKMRLQMCSTIQYALEKRQANLSYADLEVDSPYNTYQYEGLPKGPICSPGRAALEAAMIPDEHNYYFFVLKDATSGSHAFSATANEHAQNKASYHQTTDKNFID